MNAADQAALLHASALTPAMARELWDQFTTHHKERIREKMMDGNLTLHQVLNRFKTLRIDPAQIEVPPEAQGSEVADPAVEDLL